MLLVLAWLNRLLNGPGTALSSLENEEITAEALLAALDRVRAEQAAMRAEWGETLDKLSRVAARFSARERMRSKRAMDDLAEDDEPPAPSQPRLVPPSSEPDPVSMAFNPYDKNSIRQYLRTRNGR